MSQGNRVTRTIATQIRVNTGDELSLGGIRQHNEFARIDYVEFVPVSAPVVSTVVETANDDFLQGGAGNDTIFGGEGNDTLYGESANDNSSSLLKGSRTYNGHTYLLSTAGTWAEAQAEAKRLGGNLVTVNTAQEEAWLQNAFGTSQMYWMGFTDEAVEGQWQWVSGEAITYTNWSSIGPDNAHGIQHYGVLNFGPGKQWDDTDSSNAWAWDGSQWVMQSGGVRGIIEINSTHNDTLVGGDGDDILYGNAGDDRLYGDAFDETSETQEIVQLTTADSEAQKGGNDVIYGGVGSDLLQGGAGDDVLYGTDAIAAGYFEIDILGGGSGRDTFVLGDVNQAYYRGRW